jgi:hypothetical protein
MGYQQPPGIECARRELNPHALRAPVLEAGASASSATRALVRRLGFEPRSSGVRARFSKPIELTARGAAHGDRTRIISVEG